MAARGCSRPRITITPVRFAWRGFLSFTGCLDKLGSQGTCFAWVDRVLQALRLSITPSVRHTCTRFWVPRPALPIQSEKKVSDSPSSAKRPATLHLMIGAVVLQVTSLAQGAQVTQAIVRRAMVQMSRSQHHAGGPAADYLNQVRPLCGAVVPVTPHAGALVIPAAVWQDAKLPLVRTATALAATLGALEANQRTQGTPVLRIERA